MEMTRSIEALSDDCFVLMLTQLTAEDEERRRVRRERNKLAAARCRQRRVDLTNQLLAVSMTSSSL